MTRPPGDITRNYHGGADTSVEAYEETPEERRRIARQRVFDAIHGTAMEGFTCDETEAFLAMSHQTASARITELRADGLIVDSGARRRTRSGSPARVYIAADIWRAHHQNVPVGQRTLL